MPRPPIAVDALHDAAPPKQRLRRRGAEDSGASMRAREGSKPARTEGLTVVTTASSRRHPALRTAPPPWIGADVDDEAPVDAIECPDGRFAPGVQWHPEIPEDDPTAQEPHGARPHALVQAARPLSDA